MAAVALDREPVAAQEDRARKPVAERVEHAVGDAGELGGDVVRNGQCFLHDLSVGGASAAPHFRHDRVAHACELPRYARLGEEVGSALSMRRMWGAWRGTGL